MTWAQPARADVELNFDAVTSANGMTSTIKNQSIPLGLTIEGDGPTSQAHLSSLGQSDGFASFPYPGDTVVGLPGLVRAAILPGVPVPDYPFYVKSEYGSPPAGASFPGGLELSAVSRANSTDSKATVVSGSSGLISESHVVQDPAGLVASSTTKANNFVFTGVIEFSDFTSTATIKADSSRKLSESASLSIGRIAVPGLSITLPKQTPSGIPVPVPISGVPQVTVPLPPIPVPMGGATLTEPDIGFEDGQFSIQLPLLGGQKFALPTQAALSAFKAAGFDVTYQAPVMTASSVVAPELSFHTVLPAPPSSQLYSGPTDLTYSTGVTAASVQASWFDGAQGAGGSLGFLPPSGVSSSGGGPVGISNGAVGGPAASLGAVLGVGNVGVPAPPNIAPPLLSASGRLAAFQPLPLRRSVFWFYVLLVGVGIAGTAGGQVLRYLGVRASWSS